MITKKIIGINKINDIDLVSKSLKGDKDSLEKLIIHYKDWIYNIAIRMVINPQDAEDVTQEILIKIVTHLNKYDSKKAAFKTWLYRIAVNHMINMKKSKIETYDINFDNYYERMDFIEDREPVDSPEIKATIQDTMINCIMATLVCLDRVQRMVIILGVIFNVNSRLGSQIMGITDANFRKILSRSRKKLKNFMGTTCSLVNKKAKCRCKMKIMELIKHGYRNPDRLIYSGLKYDKLVRDIVDDKVTRFMNDYFYKFNRLFKSQPFWDAPTMQDWLNKVLKTEDFKEIFHLN
jgi:RNA polymerase sigma factor (sigma-70 family)